MDGSQGLNPDGSYAGTPLPSASSLMNFVDTSAAAKNWDLVHLDTSGELLKKAADIPLPAGVGYAQSTEPPFNMPYNMPVRATDEPNMQQAAEPQRRELAGHGRATTGVRHPLRELLQGGRPGNSYDPGTTKRAASPGCENSADRVNDSPPKRRRTDTTSSLSANIANINLSADSQYRRVQETGTSAAREPQPPLQRQPMSTPTHPSYDTPPRRESMAMDVCCSCAAAESAESSEPYRPLAPSPQAQSGAAAESYTRPSQTEYVWPEASSSAAMQPQNTANATDHRARATSNSSARALLCHAIANQILQDPAPLPSSTQNTSYTEALFAPPMQRSSPSVLPSMRASPSELAPPSNVYPDGFLESMARRSRNGSVAAQGTSSSQPYHDYHRNTLPRVPTVLSSTVPSSSSTQQASTSTAQDSSSTVQDAITSQPMERQRQPSIVPSSRSHDAAASYSLPPSRRHSLATPSWPLPPISSFDHIPMSQPLARRWSDAPVSHSEARTLPPWDTLVRSIGHAGRSVSQPGPALPAVKPITPPTPGRGALSTGQAPRARRLTRKAGSSNLAASCSLQALSSAQAGSSTQAGPSNRIYRPPGSRRQIPPAVQAAVDAQVVIRGQVDAEAAINAQVDAQVAAAARAGLSFQEYVDAQVDAQLAAAAHAGLSYQEYLDADVSRIDWASRAAQAASTQATPADQAPSTAQAVLTASTTTDSTITDSTARGEQTAVDQTAADQTAADQTAADQTAPTDEEPAAGPSSPTYTPPSPTYVPSSPTVPSPRPPKVKKPTSKTALTKTSTTEAG